MALKLSKKTVGVFTAKAGQTVEVDVSSPNGAEITGVFYKGQHVAKAPWKFKTVKGANTLFVYMESNTPQDRIVLNEKDGPSSQYLAHSFFSPTYPMDEIEIQA